ncbi:hypothetical protein [uncultured Paenibacillus sp.]|uniref:hypothetical protein n=1 Tax=uncultured Paenibacillus sp. TaxID=227322 RepID=UPI0015A7CF82|nr:hypothetical protein [uncultured Paenibacillus sp.]
MHGWRKVSREPTNREGAPEIESAARETGLPKFTPEQFLELPLYVTTPQGIVAGRQTRGYR